MLPSIPVEPVFWICVALVGFSYIGYPMVLAVWAGVREALGGVHYLTGGADRRRRRREDDRPSVSIVFAAS